MKFWPLVKRFGLSLALQIWITCKRSGHDWHNVGNLQCTDSWTEPEGTTIYFCKVKMRCRCCESIDLIDVRVFRLTNGAEFLYTPNGRIVIAEDL